VHESEKIKLYVTKMELNNLEVIGNGLKAFPQELQLLVSLHSLCLAQQQISHMENLNFPHLQELYLHNNQITRIENLEK
jgi:Leucine-rich repeat (LRR) protein